MVDADRRIFDTMSDDDVKLATRYAVSHRGHYYRAMTIYIEKRWLGLLTMALDRVYVLRGQIVHGAATRGSKLNRAVLRQCSQVLEGLLPPTLNLAIEHGAHDDWPPLRHPSFMLLNDCSSRSPTDIRRGRSAADRTSPG